MKMETAMALARKFTGTVSRMSVLTGPVDRKRRNMATARQLMEGSRASNRNAVRGKPASFCARTGLEAAPNRTKTHKTDAHRVAVRTEVDHLVSLLAQRLENRLPQEHAPVVERHGDFHAQDRT